MNLFILWVIFVLPVFLLHTLWPKSDYTFVLFLSFLWGIFVELRWNILERTVWKITNKSDIFRR